MSVGDDSEFSSMCNKAFAAVFSEPEIWGISVVNCEIKSNCLVSRGEYLSGLECRAKVSGRWS